jgi:hypothetical protein
MFLIIDLHNGGGDYEVLLDEISEDTIYQEAYHFSDGITSKR